MILKLNKANAILLLIITMLLFSASCTDGGTNPPVLSDFDFGSSPLTTQNVELLPPDTTGELKISYLDVGQADSAFIQLPNGETMLIDAGNQSDGQSIIEYIKDSGADRLNYVVATHPHADHIGGMAAVINAFEVESIHMPKISHTSKTFENLLGAIDEKGLTIQTAKAGKTLFDYGNLKAEFYHLQVTAILTSIIIPQC